jgi:hypothetical protein
LDRAKVRFRELMTLRARDTVYAALTTAIHQLPRRSACSTKSTRLSTLITSSASATCSTKMRKRSDTRLVPVTHNPIIMARMDRLFGVTMAERGVSQIVSVELAEAERFLEAG